MVGGPNWLGIGFGISDVEAEVAGKTKKLHNCVVMAAFSNITM